MGLRTSITERQRRLGAELRKLRERSGMVTKEAGEVIGMGSAHLSHIEAGRTSIVTSRLRALCEAYGCTDEPYVEALVDMAEDSGKGWWTEHRKLVSPIALDLAELEAGAKRASSYETLFIPGLLQTEGYMRAILGSAQRPDIEPAVRFRLERQHLLIGDDALPLHAVVHEAALRIAVGGPDVMREQLMRLIEAARLPNVTLQILPFDVGAVRSFSTSFSLLHGQAPGLETVVADTPAERTVFLGGDTVVESYADTFVRLAAAALAPIDPGAVPESHLVKDSLGLIQHVAYAL
ncbi:helix-turn-helix transcriptional regulator [Streptomyces sp. SID13588]|uniref:helix-turn-helix domain-containing protein n=1 Tax=Streptomyces sp. SID13588 TaxID=2706051 RepID=UPI0013CB685D|nr:helix-turn-helix transcriptional regulator [Streptomyces sp. SID13588]NEA73258.1 helix-turn-helix domain-containing protein [Streptomyces sp. SID13588]